jgi:hypothetical protein
MLRSAFVVLLIALLTLTPTPTSAQDAGSRAGHSFMITGAPGVGMFWRHSPATDLGLFVNAHVQGGDDSDLQAISILPTLVRFHALSDRFSPYTTFALGVTFDRRSLDLGTEVRTSKSYGPTAQVGLGLEWFPLERISVGGHAGLRAVYSRATQSETEFSEEASEDRWSLGTFTSALQARIHF